MGSVLAATTEAGSSYTPDFLMSPVFLWVAANAIIIWLFSSSRRGRAEADDTVTSPSAGHEHDGGEVVPAGTVDGQNYTSASDYGAFSDAGSSRPAEAPPVSRRLPRAAEAVARSSDRPRVRKKPQPAGQSAPSLRAFAAKSRVRDDDVRSEGTPVRVVADGVDDDDIRSEGTPVTVGVDDEDVSMDSLWQSIVQRRKARPVVVQKSDSWSNDELPRLERVAETAAATRREMRKSASAVSKAAAPPRAQPPPPSVPSAMRQLGWRTRDVLATITPDELLRRAESLIRRHHEHLRLQRQESEQRQQQLRFHLRAPGAGPIRV